MTESLRNKTCGSHIKLQHHVMGTNPEKSESNYDPLRF